MSLRFAVDLHLIGEGLGTGRSNVQCTCTMPPYSMCAWMIDEFGNQSQRNTYVPSLCSMEVRSSPWVASTCSYSSSSALSAWPPTASQSRGQAVTQPTLKQKHAEMEIGTSSAVQRLTKYCIHFRSHTCRRFCHFVYVPFVVLYQWCW